MRSKKYVVYTVVMLLIMIGIGVSYSYFVSTNSINKKEINISSKKISIIFTDKTELSESGIEPGWSTSKSFSVENKSNDVFNYNIVIKNLINTFVTEGFLQYKITSDTGYNMTEYVDVPKSAERKDVTLAYDIDIETGVKHEYTIEFIYKNSEEVDQSVDMGKEFGGTLAIVEGSVNPSKITLYDRLLADNPTILTRTDFDNVFIDINTGTLYKATGDITEGGKDVYYFAGNAQNNWIKFGKDQDNLDLYWRIIRTNEDGGIRLLYIGPNPATTTAFIKLNGKYMSGGSNTTGMYNATYNNTMYVGYMYGTKGSLSNNRTNTTSAPIKTVTENWYSQTINTKTDGIYTYDKYVSGTAIYCNDRSGDGYAVSGIMYYGAYTRLERQKAPSYKCGYNSAGGYVNTNGSFVSKAVGMYSDASNADKFTKGSITGNGKLTYPIAQITADEIAFAGGSYAKNSQAWYYYNSTGGSVVGDDRWWTMSPFYFNDSNAGVFYVLGSSNPGNLNFSGVYLTEPGIRPVLSLKSCVTYVSGDGSSDNPYAVTLDNVCSVREN